MGAGMKISRMVGLGAIVVLPILLLIVDLLLLKEEKTSPRHANPYVQIDVPTMVGPMADVQVVAVAAEKQKGTGSYKTVEWMNLIPEWEYEILSRPIPHPVDDPSLIDRIIDRMTNRTMDQSIERSIVSLLRCQSLSLSRAGEVFPRC